MLVNPNYKASGGSTPSTVLPEMNGVKYFYDLTNISAGGDIEVPNALETAEPLVLHGATVTDNAIQLTGEANGSYGTFNAPEIVETRKITAYIVYKTITIGTRPAIFTEWAANSSYAQASQIRDQSTNGTTVPGLRFGTYDNRFSADEVRTKDQYAVVVLRRNVANQLLYIAAAANVNSPYDPNSVMPIGQIGVWGYTMGEPSGKLSLMSENINLADCTANVRVVAVADAYHNTNEIIRNLGYLSQHYVEAYNA